MSGCWPVWVCPTPPARTVVHDTGCVQVLASCELHSLVILGLSIGLSPENMQASPAHQHVRLLQKCDDNPWYMGSGIVLLESSIWAHLLQVRDCHIWHNDHCPVTIRTTCISCYSQIATQLNGKQNKHTNNRVWHKQQSVVCLWICNFQCMTPPIFTTPYICHFWCRRRSPAVAYWASDHWVASSNLLGGKFWHWYRLIIPGVCLAQFSLSNVHKRGLKHHHYHQIQFT